MSNPLRFFASCPKGIEALLAQELAALDATEIKETRAGVHFSTLLVNAFKICLWSRLANHIFLPIAQGTVTDWESLSQFAFNFDWSEQMSVDNTFAIDVDLVNSTFSNNQYAMQRFKDGLVDYWREKTAKRPTVKTIQPDLRFHLFIKKDALTLSLNLSGDSLHRRGYRPETSKAPLKENLAAAILMRANWPKITAEGGSLFDPLCGSATLLIEGAMMAADIAPGLLRDYFGFLHWQGFIPAAWKKFREEARERREQGLKNIPRIVGYDSDLAAIHIAQGSIQRMNLESFIHIEKRELAQCEGLSIKPGLVICNPPYGERLGEKSSLQFTYQHLGDLFKTYFNEWQCSVFTGNPELAKALRLGPENIYKFYNGTIPCQLLNFIIRKVQSVPPPKKLESATLSAPPPLPEAIDFANRLRKNSQQREAIAKRENVSCYRLYDADLPDYALAIDQYEDVYHVQEYAPPKTIDSQKAALRLEQAVAQIKNLFSLKNEQIFLKTRQKQKGLMQYQKQNKSGQFKTVREGELKFLVNLGDYLDTGLFLDSRWIRKWISKHTQGKNFLNLFCYTGSATVYAALGKAAKTVSVDMSKPYLEWAKRNLALNGFNPDKHQFVQADCLKWLKDNPQKFDVILLDPPTFSNSKRMEDTLDIQRDHLKLIDLAMQHLTKNGTLIFVTNKQNFKWDATINTKYQVDNITEKSLPFDFKRYKIHQAYFIQHK